MCSARVAASGPNSGARRLSERKLVSRYRRFLTLAHIGGLLFFTSLFFFLFVEYCTRMRVSSRLPREKTTAISARPLSRAQRRMLLGTRSCQASSFARPANQACFWKFHFIGNYSGDEKNLLNSKRKRPPPEYWTKRSTVPIFSRLQRGLLHSLLRGLTLGNLRGMLHTQLQALLLSWLHSSQRWIQRRMQSWMQSGMQSGMHLLDAVSK